MRFVGIALDSTRTPILSIPRRWSFWLILRLESVVRLVMLRRSKGSRHSLMPSAGPRPGYLPPAIPSLTLEPKGGLGPWSVCPPFGAGLGTLGRLRLRML